MSNALLIASVAALMILGWVLFLYRRGRLKEDHALLWTSVSVAILILSTWTALLVAVNQVVGADKVSDVVFASFVGFLILVNIYFSIRISELTEQNKKIAQEIAVIKTTNAEKVRSPQDRG